MHLFLATDRLLLRRFTRDDADLLVALDSDPEVMRFLGNGKPTPPERIRDEVLPRILGFYERHPGYGFWAAVEKATGEFLGWFALEPPVQGPPDEVELGYRLRRAAWGHGYATEGSRALVTAGFATYGAQRVWATTMAVNTRSRRVLEKAGLRHVRTYHEDWADPLPGSEHGEVEYALTREQWLAGR